MRLWRCLFGLAIALLYVCSLPALARADSTFERLLMPGPVAAAHAKFEEKCGSCHKPFAKGVQDSLCLSCHKPVAADITAKTGFHGRSPLMRGVACSYCHDDHKGRDADIIHLDSTLFQHDSTDFPLTGAHRATVCASCHVKGKPFRVAPSACFACHDKDQPHKRALGNDCQNCHRTTAWTDRSPFDHGKTRYPLLGKHAEVRCLSCHLGEIYKGLPSGCNDCHAIQDVHQRRFGSDCARCHTESGWPGAKFDHARDGKFPLRGAHAAAKCQSCHGTSVRNQLPTACFDCHAKQDVHKTQLGSSCGTCHTESAWRKDVKFDHDLTRFPLTGLHAVVACESCHATAAFKGAPLACKDCHSKNDTHEGRFTSRCESCHSANGWKLVFFDHGRDTRFALTGRHAATACYDCHVTRNVTTARISTDCFSCHAKQDVHRGAFGRDCGRCHTAASFKTAIIRR
jgi:hypothetical protein